MALSELLRRIRDGEIATKQEAGFTFVDVAPYSKKIERPLLPPQERPTTFTRLSDAEIAALNGDVEDDRHGKRVASPMADEPESIVQPQELEEDHLPDITESDRLEDWRQGRAAARRRRTPPPRARVERAA
jgi:hypothetical protein